MLTADKEFNRDYNKNNLFLNLDFQNQEETFEYKDPLLDIPSNYQVMVTKLTTRTSLPYIKLHDSKKSLSNEKNFLYDYSIKMLIVYKDHLNPNNIKSQEINQFLITRRFTVKNNFLFSCSVNQKNKEQWKSFVDENIDYGEGGKWGKYYDSGIQRNIYSLAELFQMINDTIGALFVRVFNLDLAKHPAYIREFEKLKKIKYFLNFKYENETPIMKINEYFVQQMGINFSGKQMLLFNLFFSKNLFKFFKGLPIVPSDFFKGEYCYLNIPNLKTFYELDESIDLITNVPGDIEGTIVDVVKTNSSYYSLNGGQIKIMDVSDYIGIAITTTNFPVKEQIYPHFEFNFKTDLLSQNRRRYIPKSEGNIDKYRINENSQRLYLNVFEKEYINNTKKFALGERILFIKYFGKDDDLNCINYENNDTNSSLKMDLLNSMPLKKFTLRLYLIDRYNNFEPLYPKIEGFDDVIKLQLLFTRITGNKKENRDFIETEHIEPEKVYLELVDEEEEEEEEEEITPPPEPEPEAEAEPEVLLLPIPIPVKSEKLEENDENLEAPPEKRIYLNTEEEENPENELY